jgi:hypothetical protein
MDMLRRHVGELDWAMNSLVADMKEFTTRNAASLQAPAIRPLPMPADECGLLTDIDRSRRLMEAQPEKWLALTERCESN